MIEVEFGWWVGGVGVLSHNHVKPNSVEVVLRLSWGCDNSRMNEDSLTCQCSTVHINVQQFIAS